MVSELYDVVFEGVAEGRDLEQVKQALAQLFHVEVARVEHFFTAPGAVVQASVDAVTADKYIARLALIGVVASKLAVASALSLEPMAVTPATAADSASAESSSTFHAAAREDSPVADRRVPFQFNGKGFEYFKIWIVNILLSLVTLGIYSAWAKVRNKQYFYGNTQLDGASFEYTAEPLKILKGRAIAVAFFACYSIAGKISPSLALVFALLLLVFLPWIIVSSLKFNARHSSYRNLNFRFVGSIWGAIKAFILWPAAGFLSLGILLPWAWKKQVAYSTNNHLYGAEPFVFAVSVKEYYKLLLVLLGVTVGFIAFLAAVFGTALLGMAGKGSLPDMNQLAMILPAMLAYFAFYFFVGAYFITRMANIHFNHSRLQQQRLAANWSVASYALLLFTNTLGIFLTLGLFIPFARVRTAAYKAAHTQLLVSGDLGHFIAAEREHSNALGEGVHDIFDIDISL